MYHKPKDVVQAIAEVVLKFTGGHFYPFVSILDDFISSSKEMEWDKASAWKHLYSEKYFKSERHNMIVGRCFSIFDDPYLVSTVRNLLLGLKGDHSHYQFLRDLGLWDATTRKFVSFLLWQHLLQLCCQEQAASLEKKFLVANHNWLSQTAVVVAAGLEGLDHPACFNNTPGGGPASEEDDGLGTAWAMQAQERIPNVFLLGPVAALVEEKLRGCGGPPPTVDSILLNGNRLNTTLKLIRNDCRAN